MFVRNVGEQYDLVQPQLSELRRNTVLRQLTQPPRHTACTNKRASRISSAEPGERWLYCYMDDAYTDY